MFWKSFMKNVNLVEKICLGTGLCHLWSVNLLLSCNIGTEDELWLNPKMLISDFFLFFLVEVGGCGERSKYCALHLHCKYWMKPVLYAGVAFFSIKTYKANKTLWPSLLKAKSKVMSLNSFIFVSPDSCIPTVGVHKADARWIHRLLSTKSKAFG